MIHYCHSSGRGAVAAATYGYDAAEDAVVVVSSAAAGYCCCSGSLLRPVVCRTARQTSAGDTS